MEMNCKGRQSIAILQTVGLVRGASPALRKLTLRRVLLSSATPLPIDGFTRATKFAATFNHGCLALGFIPKSRDMGQGRYKAVEIL